MRLETIKVVSDNEDGFKVINKSDFDADEHEEYSELNNDDNRFNEIIVNLKDSSSKDLKFAIKKLGLEYKNKDDAILQIEEFLNLKEEE